MIFLFFFLLLLLLLIRELRREKAWARIFITPLLVAEHDRDIVRRQMVVTKREDEVLGYLPGFTPGDLKSPVPYLAPDGTFTGDETGVPVYYTKRYVKPSFVVVKEGDDGQKKNAQWWRGSRMLLKNPQYSQF